MSSQSQPSHVDDILASTTFLAIVLPWHIIFIIVSVAQIGADHRMYGHRGIQPSLKVVCHWVTLILSLGMTLSYICRRWWYINQYYVAYYLISLQLFPTMFSFGMFYIWTVIGVIRRTAGSLPLGRSHAAMFIIPAIIFHCIMIPLSMPGHWLGGYAGPATCGLMAIIWDAAVFRAYYGLKHHVNEVLNHQRNQRHSKLMDSSPLLAAVRRIMLMGWLGIIVLLVIVIIMAVVIMIDVKAVQLVTVTVWMIALPVLTWASWINIPRPICCGGHAHVIPLSKNNIHFVSQRMSSGHGHGNGDGVKATSPMNHTPLTPTGGAPTIRMTSGITSQPANHNTNGNGNGMRSASMIYASQAQMVTSLPLYGMTRASSPPLVTSPHNNTNGVTTAVTSPLPSSRPFSHDGRSATTLPAPSYGIPMSTQPMNNTDTTAATVQLNASTPAVAMRYQINNGNDIATGDSPSPPPLPSLLPFTSLPIPIA